MTSPRTDERIADPDKYHDLEREDHAYEMAHRTPAV